MKQNEQNIYEVIAKNLKIIRQLKGLTLKEMSKILGVTGQQMQKYEVGKNKISISSLAKVAEFFNLPISFFFQEIDWRSFIDQEK